MSKYKIYFLKMINDNSDLFESFRKIHEIYAQNPERFQEIFNQEGKKVLEVVHEYENRLCANTERGIYSKFSKNLAEKFQNEVRKAFPLIDHVGLIVKKKVLKNEEDFTIKKITL